MFLQILRRDLKRKRTMNIILLLFVILASMFTASSANNIMAVTKGLDYFSERSGIPSYDRMIIMYSEKSNLVDILAGKDYVQYYDIEDFGCIQSWSDVTKDGKKIKEIPNTINVLSIDNAVLNYFDINNNRIETVEKGKFYGNIHFYRDTDLKVGDTVSFRIKDRTVELEYAGALKDIVFGSELTAMPRIIVNDSDFTYLFADAQETDYHCYVGFVKTTDDEKLLESISGINCMSFSTSLVKVCFVLNMVVAYILLAASLGLMGISLAILRFTIGFTITEEFREIGVMKALGISNFSIRSLYLVKYLALSIIGSAIGFFLSLPFAKMMLRSVSEVMCLGNTHSILAGIICSAGIVVIIMLFCFGCTSKIKKLSPIDAVRNGQTGERFGRRSVMHLGRSRLSATGFLAVNDIFSSPKQFGMVAAILTLCMLLVMLVSNLIASMKNAEILSIVGSPIADAYFCSFESDEATQYDKVEHGGELFADSISEKLKENGMPAKCTFNYMVMLKTEHDGKALAGRFIYNPREDMDAFKYDEGCAPRADDEIALSWGMLDELNAKIGDHVKVTTLNGERECMVTAAFSTVNNSGLLGILYNGTKISPQEVIGGFGVNIYFDGDLTQAQIDENIEKIKDIYNTDQVFNGRDFATYTLGIGNTLDAVKYLLVIVTIIIVLMLTILIERSFIAKEKCDIALMKALGTQNGSIIAQHTLRFVLISVIVCVIASVASIPLTGCVLTPILSMVGKVRNVPSSFNAADIFLINPMILIAVTTLGAFCTSLFTRTITANDAASIE